MDTMKYQQELAQYATTERRAALLSVAVAVFYVVMTGIAAANGAALATTVVAVLGLGTLWTLGVIWYSARADKQMLETIAEIEDSVLS